MNFIKNYSCFNMIIANQFVLRSTSLTLVFYISFKHCQLFLTNKLNKNCFTSRSQINDVKKISRFLLKKSCLLIYISTDISKKCFNIFTYIFTGKPYFTCLINYRKKNLEILFQKPFSVSPY